MPEIAILLATKDGERFLEEQLESYLWQSLNPSILCVSDDGSCDDTNEIVFGFAQRAPFPVSVVTGPKAGPAQNFLNLIRHCPAQASFAALSDQDDLWLPDKLARGVELLRHAEGPAIYCGRSVIADTDLKPLRLFPKRGPVGFAHALRKGLAGGNTMILNRRAIDVARATYSRQLTTHDWWLYQLITGVGGTVIYDQKPTVLYRQHQGNLVGAPVWVHPAFRRLRQIRRGGYARWNAPQIETLHRNRALLTRENRQILYQFRNTRMGLPDRKPNSPTLLNQT